MTNDEYVCYWVETAEEDYASVERLFAAGEYVWALFVGHLVIEKFLKACCARSLGQGVPRIHDLLRLADRAGLAVEPKRRRWLDRLTTLQTRIRYPDMRHDVYRIATKEFAERYLVGVRELRQWLLEVVSK